MTVRLRIALTIFATGLVTAIGVILTVIVSFQRFESEATFERASAFLERVVFNYDNIVELHERQPEEFAVFLRNLVLLEPNSQLYLLDAGGRVLASTGSTPSKAGVQVALAPVQQAIAVRNELRSGRPPPRGSMPYVLGDDPERMEARSVVAAQPLRRPQIQPDQPVAGYLYLVCNKPPLPPGQLAVFRSSLVGPALLAVLGVVALATLLAAWIVATVTRPLRELSAEVAAVTRDGLAEALPAHGSPAGTPPRPAALGGPGLSVAPPGRLRNDEIVQLRQGFHAMLGTLRSQWDALRRLDHFRREGVSNLSHDLRSPLTATVACLETLEQRWAALGDPGSRDAEERRLVEVALRNTRNTARMVQSLGELAQLDEPEFRLRAEPVDLGELLDDIALRFAARAAQQGVQIDVAHPGNDPAEPTMAWVDIELFERAIANLLGNALKFCPAGTHITLQATALPAERAVLVQVRDDGPGIAEADLPHLFDRFYQARQSVAPATGEGGKGLGLAIVKRIVELHRGSLSIRSQPGQGTELSLRLPADRA